MPTGDHPNSRGHSTKNNRRDKRNLKFEIRRLREQRVPERELLHDLNITRPRFYKLLDEIDTEDEKSLAFDNPGRLHSTINVYRETLDYCIAVNRKICDDPTTSAKDKQESTKIIADCALTWVKVQKEGPRVIRELYEPIGSYVGMSTAPIPMPKGQRDRLTTESSAAVQQTPDGGITVPVPEEEEGEDE